MYHFSFSLQIPIVAMTMSSAKSSMSIRFYHRYSLLLFLALQLLQPDFSLAIEFSRELSFLSKNVKLFFFSLILQCLIFHPIMKFHKLLNFFK